MYAKFAALAALVAAARAQQACSLTAETHPSMTWSTCTGNGACTSNTGSVTIDANWRWTHALSNTTNCYSGNLWDSSICNSDTTCAAQCCVDGADYANTYGVSTSGNALNLKFVTKGQYSTNVGSRMYLMASDTAYQTFTLLGNEFTFDVDVSNLGCGLNGALYFVSMDADGGLSKYSGNKAGAKYGTGYCDSQCPRDLKFINGQANIDGWTASTNDANAGMGNHGSCCSEMDIWEANKMSAAYTPHPCTDIGQTMCTGDACGGTYSTNRYAGVCDPDGCDFNSYRMGNTTFYGPGMTIDTNSKFTVVTQFLKGSDGNLSEIKRFYVQNGKIVPNSQSNIAGVAGNSITQSWCDAQKTAFGDVGDFNAKGGLAQMGKALAQPMVLVMSVWDDHAVNMLWLDSTYPTNSTALGTARGTCATTSGVPADLESQVPNSNVIYSNVRFGPINSTVAGLSSVVGGGGGSTGGGTTSSSTSTQLATSTTSASGGSSTGGAAHYAQCGGVGWTGATTCQSPYTCTQLNSYYSQCL
ncbi:cellulose 1,4-beta-cellobiosidase [Diplogelasinospora grovesii]|uniref:Glucanase n=1 Tax=Diplogelasinospora grovesii TaxID=303347 RepID=A0AAN6MXE9_9PEZI|nr:cellulose 1,4-beta-cellobiosidase [Diplogelasinospora grovesii]